MISIVSLMACQPQSSGSDGAGSGGSASVPAKDPAKDPAQRADLLIHADRVFVGDGTSLESVTIVVDGGKIVAITPRSEASWTGGETIDASGATVIPGMIDTHVHLLALAAESEATATRYRETELPAKLQAYLELGVTTLRSAGDPWQLILGVREDLQAKKLQGPRLAVAGAILTAPGGHPAGTTCAGSEWCAENVTRQVDNPEDARREVAALAASKVDLIKFVHATVRLPAVPTISLEIVDAIVAESKAQGLSVVAHAFPDRAAVDVIAEGVTGLVHIPFGGDMDDAELAKTIGDLPVSTTLGISHPVADGEGGFETPYGRPWTEVSEAKRVESDRRTLALWQAGTRLAFGTDVPMMSVEQGFWHEAHALRDAGLAPADVLVAATGNAALALGLGDQIGKVAEGFNADLVVVDGDPSVKLDDLERVRVVIQDGAIVVDRRK